MNKFYLKLISADIITKMDMISDSQIATGTQNLIKDLSSWLLMLVPLVGVVFIIYFAIRRGAADEQDKKQWDGRIKTVIVSVIIGLLASAIINLISSYYGGTTTVTV